MKNVKKELSHTVPKTDLNRFSIISEKVSGHRDSILNFFLIDPSGDKYFLKSHRNSNSLFYAFKSGLSLGEIQRLKHSTPKRRHPHLYPREQISLHSIYHLTRIAANFIRYELAEDLSSVVF